MTSPRANPDAADATPADLDTAAGATPADLDTGEPPYRVAWTISTDSVIDASRLATASVRSRLAILSVAAVVAGGVMTLLGEWTAGPLLVIFGIATLVMWVLRGPERWLVGRRLRGVAGSLSELTIDDAGLEIRSRLATGRIAWEALSAVRDDERSVVFMRDRMIALYAPAAAFGTPQRRAAAIGYARERIAAARAATVGA